MELEDDHLLRDLLDHASQPGVPGSFADNVLRRIRLDTSDAVGLGTWWARTWKMASGVTAGAALLATAALFQEISSPSSTAITENITPEISALLAVEDVNNLGDLETALDDNDIWLGTSSY